MVKSFGAQNCFFFFWSILRPSQTSSKRERIRLFLYVSTFNSTDTYLYMFLFLHTMWVSLVSVDTPSIHTTMKRRRKKNYKTGKMHVCAQLTELHIYKPKAVTEQKRPITRLNIIFFFRFCSMAIIFQQKQKRKKRRRKKKQNTK